MNSAIPKRLFQKCLVRPQDVTPSQDDLEVIGTFNPGAVAMGDGVVLMVRVAERPKERRAGWVALPRWELGTGVVIDWIPETDMEFVDPRVVRIKATGLVRLTFISHIRIMHSRDGQTIDSITKTYFVPETLYEEYGVEDPRITCIDDRYYITYVAVSRHGAATALAATHDFQSFERYGVVFYPENKDVVLFPEKIGNAYMALHRPNAATPFTMPEIWTASSPDLLHWGRQMALTGGAMDWEAGRVGAGVPPVRAPHGWLEIYHGNERVASGSGVGAYTAGVMLLDPEQPHRVMARSTVPVLVPEAGFEREGFVPNVVFPTGIVERGDSLWIYYGAADTVVGVAELARCDVFRLIGG